MFIARRTAGLLAAVVAAAFIPAGAAGQAPPAQSDTSAIASTAAALPPAELRPVKASHAPTIDGALDDDAWQQQPMTTGEWKSYNPLHGDTIKQQTTVWITYDADYMYVAFKCDDPEPKRIRTSITRRDNAWPDDWVGLSLDALGSGQIAYHMMVNPSGVQMDMLQTVAGGEDQSVDWVWDSAGRLTETGYAVEIRLPLQSIRFRGGNNVKMGVLFWRRVSRIGVSVSWPALEPGRWVFEKHAALVFPDIQPRLPRQVIPSTTYSRSQSRDTPSVWAKADGQGDFGVTTKMGLSPTITLDATVNPDFSQVESDAFQVQVNQRFPVFFSERRPFFMEGAGIFSLAGQGDDNSLQYAVHTRRIVDPIFGAKLTGNVGRVTFATLSAVDQQPGRSLEGDDPLNPGSVHPDAGRERVFNIARAQYSLGPNNYAGAIVTDTEFAGGHNRVIGSDLAYRLSKNQRISGFVLGSESRAPHAGDSKAGVAGVASYSYNTMPLGIYGAVEHYDRDFQMDTAFLNRVGLTSGWAFVERNFYPDKVKYPWIRRVSGVTFVQGGRDRIAGGDELFVLPGVRLNFTRQGFLRVDRSFGFETWANRRFDRGRWRAFGSAQLLRWLALNGDFNQGLAVFYDPLDPYAGRSRDSRLGFTLQPNGRFSQFIEYRRVAFDRESTGERVYDLDIVNSRTTYQFTRSFFLRALVQYDSSRSQVLTDFLSSYELRPGTVVYVGYGSLIERREFVDGRWIPNEGTYQTSTRGLFFKASYLYRF
jgi:uncharacterized protein DUF5916/cellulose/xylan binding protein with CBM9 domain